MKLFLNIFFLSELKEIKNINCNYGIIANKNKDHSKFSKYLLMNNFNILVEKPLFLNKLLGQNLLFLSKELGLNISTKIFTKVEVESLEPEKVDENGWQSFKGEFKTNFILPSFIGFGNGITRGFGSIFSLNNLNNLEFKDSKEAPEDYVKEEINDDDAAISYVTVDDAPIISRRKKKKKFKTKKKPPYAKNHSRKIKYKEKNNNSIKQEVDSDDESRFNSEEYHKKQHDF